MGRRKCNRLVPTMWYMIKMYTKCALEKDSTDMYLHAYTHNMSVMFSFPIQYVHEKMMGLTFRISPDAFFQGMNVTANRMLETFD